MIWMRTLILTAFVCLFLPLTTHAWQIADFNSAVTIQKDGSVSVKETIAVDFGTEEKHGIFRDIPIVYENSPKNVYIRISNISVTQDGSDAITDTNREGHNLNIRIGDADQTITGKHTYTISYLVEGVLRSFDTYDELYWNVTGNGWDAPIARASASVSIPASILKQSCYKGAYGATDLCDTSNVTDKVATFTAKNLASYEGLTVAVGFSPGVVPIVEILPPPSLSDALASPLTLGITLVATLSGLFVLIRIWWLYGRDRFWLRPFLPGVRSDRDIDMPEKILPLLYSQPVSVEYDSPDSLRPAEIGILMDERADTLDVSATIVDMASRGYLEITEEPKTWLFGKVDYVFTSTGKKKDDLLGYERLLLEKLFEHGASVKMSSLKNSFYQDLKKVKDALYKEVVDKKIFAANPSRIRGIYIGVGVALMVFAFLGVILLVGLLEDARTLSFYHSLLLGLAIAFGLLGIAILVLSPCMPRKNAYGRELYQRALGYKLFVSGTERYRARFAEDNSLFTAVLPYAIVFGVTDKLAKAFKDMGITPPSPGWYHGSAAFNPALFAIGMQDFSKSLGSAMASAPSSSGSGGGGFSGGGFGGGGGGSW